MKILGSLLESSALEDFLMKVLCWFIPKSLIKKNTPLWFLKLGFVERTSPRELGRTTRVRWFQREEKRYYSLKGKFILHKYEYR